MRRCSGCGKRRINRASIPTQQAEAPTNWESKADLGWPQVEFTGGNKNDLVFKGATGRKYLAGNNQYHRVIRVHPQDYNDFLRMRYFKKYEGPSSSRMVSTPTPKAKPAPKVEPKKEEKTKPPARKELDITKMRVRDVFEYDWSTFNPRALDIIIGQEEKREPKPRTTILKYLQRQRDGLSASQTAS